MKNLARPGLLALAALTLFDPAGAASYTWKGGAIGAPSAWSVGLNWQGNAAPPAGSQTVLVFGGPLSISFNDIADGFVLQQLQASGVATLGGKSLALAGVQPGIDVASGASLTLNAALVGDAAWRKTGAGSLALGGSNTGLSGALDIQAGRVDAGTATALGTGRVTVQTGAELRTVAGQFVGGVAGGGNWVASGATVLGAASAQTFAGSLTGLANLIVNGAARQSFTGSLNHVGTTSVEGGDLALTGPAAQALGGTALQVIGGGKAMAADGARWTLTGTTSLASALAGSTSSLRVDGGAVFTTRRLVLADGGQGQARLTLAGAASRLSVAEDAVIGRSGTGVAQLEAGQASSLTLTLGDLGGASGVLDLSAGAQWRVGTGLEVGRGGTGQLGVAGGARLESLSAGIGTLPGSNGRVVLDGPGSFWLNGGPMSVGAAGQGLLALGGTARSSTVALTVGSQLTGQGRLQLDGGADLAVQGALVLGQRGQAWLDLTGDAHLGSGSATLGEGAGGAGVALLQSAHWTVTDLLQLGGAGRAEMTQQGSSLVTAGRLDLGSSGATAALNVQGGSLAVTGLARVGGGGQLLVADGGAFAAGGGMDLGAFGGDGAGLTVARGGRFNATDVRVGVAGQAALDVQAGSFASLQSLAVGSAASGRVSVVGALAGMEVTNEVDVGGALGGVLTLADGGRLRSGAARVGGGSGAADVMVAGQAPGGAASGWLVGGDLRVGGATGGASLLSVTAAGRVSSSGWLRVGSTGQVVLGGGGELSVLGIDPASTGTLVWTGGTLAITGDGGAVLGATRYLPRVLSLQGDQVLDVRRTLNVGAGTVVLSDQARLRAETLVMGGGQIVGSAPLDLSGMVVRGHGIVASHISGSAGGALIAEGGSLSVGNIDDSYGLTYDGELRSRPYSLLTLLGRGGVFARGNVVLEPFATLASADGIVLDGGDLTALGQGTVNGTFVNQGRAGAVAGALLVFDGRVFGNGSYFGNVAFESMLNPAGRVTADELTLSLTSDVVLMPRSGAFLAVSGMARLAGGLLVEMYGVQMRAGQSFDLMSWDARVGSFSGMVVNNLAAGLAGEFSYGDHGLRLTLTDVGGTPPAVPEPGPAALLAAGLAVMALLARRRMPAAPTGSTAQRER